jgi:hypothetical protein
MAPRLAIWLVLAAAYAMVLRLNLPGHLSVDSVLALREGRLGLRETWNPAIYGWLLGLGDRVRPGAAVAMAVSAGVLFAAWALLAGLRPRTSWLAPLVAAGLVLLPQAIIYPGIVWKDVWFAEATIAGFVVLAFALQSRSTGARLLLLAAAAVLFAVAGLLRQNGLILALAAAGALAAVGWSAGAGRAMRTAATWFAAVIGVAFLLSIVAQPQGAAARPDSAGARGVRIVQMYDIVGAAAREPLPLEAFDRHDPTLDDFVRARAAKAYSPERVDTLLADAEFAARLGPTPTPVVQSAWLDLVLEHPGVYLATRAEVFRWVVATPVIDRCLPVHVGVEGPAFALDDLDMAPRRAMNDLRLFNYVTWFLDTPAYSHLAFAGVAVAVGLLLMLRRSPADWAMAALMGGALLFTASFFVISLACDYRYLYVLDLAAMTGLLYVALDPPWSNRDSQARAMSGRGPRASRKR